jgi:hypothetical protein
VTWAHVRRADVIPERMLKDLERLDAAGELTMAEIHRLCREYADELREKGMLPEITPYWLAHHLKVQR